MTDPKCHTCQGCGFVADDDDRTPWVFYDELHAKHPASDVAVRMGLVKKMPCPECNAEGKVEPDLQAIAERIAVIFKRLEETAELAREMLTLDDLAAFEQYISHQDAVGFIFDPTAYRRALQDGQFEEARMRVTAIRALLKVKK